MIGRWRYKHCLGPSTRRIITDRDAWRGRAERLLTDQRRRVVASINGASRWAAQARLFYSRLAQFYAQPLEPSQVDELGGSKAALNNTGLSSLAPSGRGLRSPS